jgi:uncharacterized protein YciI
VEFDSYTFVILRDAPDVPHYPDDVAMQQQRDHLAYLTSMGKAGQLLAAGPLRDQPDESMRGLCFFCVDADEVRKLLADDPHVRAGNLVPEIMTWVTPKGGVHFTPA